MNAVAPLGSEKVGGLDDAAQRLIAFIGSVASGIPCTLYLARPSPGAASSESVTLSLLRLVPVGGPRDGNALLALRAEFLLAVSMADPFAGLHVLGEIAFAAISRPEYEVAAPEGEASGLLISFRLLRARAQPSAPPVRFPLRPRVEPAEILRGVLVDKAGTQLAHVPVALRHSNESTSTDQAGAFRIAAGVAGAVLEAEIQGVRRPLTGGDDGIFSLSNLEE